MSLPGVNTGAPGSYPHMLSPKELEAMDAPLMALASKAGDLRRLLHAFFSFLNRRTDFYLVPNQQDVEEGVPLKMGFKEGDAEKLLLAAFRQFPLRRMPRQGGGGGKGGGKPAAGNSSTTQEKSASKASKPSGATATDAPKKTTEKDSDKSNAPETSQKKDAPKEQPSKKKNKELEDPMADVRYTEEGLQKPVGNGGSTKKYKWTQTINETSVITAVPEGTRGKDLDVTIKSSSISIRLKKAPKEGEAAILEGGLGEKIRTDESTWSLEGGALVLTLEKVSNKWWETVIVGDEKIDTTLVDSTRKIGEYDDATQGAIRKILFDQRQERLGLPTSDEILGKKPSIPPMPPGVEYIDKEKLDANVPKKSGS